MADQLVTLALDGRGSLTFRDATGPRLRRIAGGGSFTTDLATAAILLEDPRVSEVGPTVVSTPTRLALVPAPTEPVADGPTDHSALKVPQLRELLTAAGLDVSGKRAELLGRLQAHEAALAAAAAAEVDAESEATDPGDDEPGDGAGSDDPEPAAEGGTTPATPAAEDEDDPTLGRRTDLTALTGAVTIGDLPDGAKVGPEQQ